MEPLCDSDYIPIKDFRLRKSLWEMIEDLVESNDEKSELKKVIGQSLIDETLDLHCELNTLHEIWAETQENNETQQMSNKIPEPPFLRENLEKQITLLVDLLKQKLKKQGEGAVSAFLTEDDRQLIKSVSSDHIVRSTQSVSPSSNCETPTSDYYSRCSSSLSVDVESLQENMNVSEVDSIAQNMRDDFEEERKELLKDITYVQSALIYESDLKLRENEKRVSSPSIRELQKLSTKLEKQVLSDVSMNQRVSSSTHAHARSPQSRKLKPLSRNNSLDSDNLRTRTASIDKDNNSNNNNSTSVVQMRFTPSPPTGGKLPTPPSSGRRDTATRPSHMLRRTIQTKKEMSPPISG